MFHIGTLLEEIKSHELRNQIEPVLQMILAFLVF